MADPITNKQIIKGAYEAMSSGNVRGFLEVLDELKQMFGKAAPVLDVANLELHELTAEDDRVVALLHIPLRNGGGSALISEHLRLRAGKAIALQAFWFDAGVVTSTG